MASTPLPPDDGENNHASELPTGLRLSDVERLAVERLEGTAQDMPGAPAPQPANDGETDRASELSTGIRLSDAARIASERLDGAADGSLEEALAVAPPDAPSGAALPLADRIEAVAESRAAEPPAPCLDAKPAAEPSDQQPMAEQQLELSEGTPIEGSGAAFLPVESVAAPSPAAAEAAADGGLATKPAEDMHAPAGDASQVVAPAPSPGVEVPEPVQPLASALDAAARLAADANAAAAALENLKRLLERQLPNLAASNAPAAAEAGTQTSANAPAAPAMPPPLPSLPLHAVRDGSGRSTLRPAVLAPPPPRRAPVERVRFDVRGFLAGFALSWAFGIVLYLFMTAG
jgi:hypothetical protein